MGKIIRISRPPVGRYFIETEGRQQTVAITGGQGIYRHVIGDPPTGAFGMGGSVLHIARDGREFRAIVTRSEDIARVDGHATFIAPWSVRKPAASAG